MTCRENDEMAGLSMAEALLAASQKAAAKAAGGTPSKAVENAKIPGADSGGTPAHATQNTGLASMVLQAGAAAEAEERQRRSTPHLEARGAYGEVLTIIADKGMKLAQGAPVACRLFWVEDSNRRRWMPILIEMPDLPRPDPKQFRQNGRSSVRIHGTGISRSLFPAEGISVMVEWQRKGRSYWPARPGSGWEQSAVTRSLSRPLGYRPSASSIKQALMGLFQYERRFSGGSGWN
ncbi:hypothetical protein E3E12_04225 [Formicincola oecophyllae]|uniref:Uncharacterized protein n=1 Tax=Formicincola oecophyllae TaxID=2558361 RepID=A0A4Y6U7X4_9PROT|nr:hypothetical protein [Formicincola oecophyllae]QDH13533.1 hypothetical protein E3E12_04225 [Formicincola oecophyllae]